MEESVFADPLAGLRDFTKKLESRHLRIWRNQIDDTKNQVVALKSEIARLEKIFICMAKTANLVRQHHALVQSTHTNVELKGLMS